MITARLAWTSLRHSLATYGLGIAAIACAVGFLVAGSMVSSAFQASTASISLAAPLETTAVVTGSDRIPDDVVGGTAGVPVLGSAATLVDVDGAALASPGALTVADERVVRILDGRLPSGPGEVALDPFLANLADARVGDQVRFAGVDGAPVNVTLVGLSSPAYGTEQQIVLTRQAVQSAVGGLGWSHVLLFEEPAANAQALADMQSRVVDQALSLASEDPEAVAAPGGTLAALLFALLFVVLVASVFVISNSFAAVAEARRQQTALLRVVGASTTQVRQAVMLEGLAIGALGTLLGIVLGAIGGRLASLRLLYPLWPSTRLLVFAAIIGMVVTLVALWIPARQASLTAPLDALRGATVASVEGLPSMRAALAIPLLVGIVLVVQVPLAGAVFGGALAFIALVVLGPWLAPRMAKALVRGSSLTARLTRANIRRNPRRSARVAAALMLGVGLAATGTAVASALVNLNELDARFRVAVVAPTVTAELAEEITALPGVDDVGGVGTSFGFVGIGVDGDTDTIRSGVESIVASYPGARLATAEDYRAQLPFAQQLGRGIMVMASLALLVGIIGVINAITLGVWERQRELAVLRALGVEQRQVRAMVVREAIGLTTIGVTFGLILGVVTIYGLLGALSILLIPFISWWLVGLVCLVTVAASVVAAWWPARVAAKVPPTRALAAMD